MKGKILGFKRNRAAHITAGFITVLSGYFLSPLLGIGLWISFLAIEIWNKKEWETSQDDFWEYVLGIFVCSAVLLGIKLVLKLIGGLQ